DLFPTMLQLEGLDLRTGDHRDGLSLASRLISNAALPDRTFYWHNPAPRPTSTGDWFSSAIREGHLKLLEFPTEQRIELYDLSSDIQEAQNLADSQPADRDRLLKKLHDWKATVGAEDAPRGKRGASN
ncbi:MAG: hypothetical protein KDA91_01850, partial [Planctomycetaceae bacterium]|nr:hypothetical protein [Planctomycetaceae bacterium]